MACNTTYKTSEFSRETPRRQYELLATMSSNLGPTRLTRLNWRLGQGHSLAHRPFSSPPSTLLAPFTSVAATTQDSRQHIELDRRVRRTPPPPKRIESATNVHQRACYSSSNGADDQQVNAAKPDGELSRTALYDLHIANGGKMVPFGGYSMPVQYSDLSVGESHKWTREKASLLDEGHM